jgi:hypothetical protein
VDVKPPFLLIFDADAVFSTAETMWDGTIKSAIIARGLFSSRVAPTGVTARHVAM